MDLTSIPKPDDVLVAYLSEIFGPAALIVILYKLYLIGKAWLDVAIAAKRNADSIGNGFRRLVGSGLESAGGALVAAVAVGVMIVAWVALSYAMGNGASYLVFGRVPISGPRLEPFLAWRRDDWVSQFVIQGAVLLAVLAIVLGVAGKSAEWIAWILILPWCLFGLLTGALAAFYGIGAVYNWFQGAGFAVNIYGVRVNPVMYAALAVAAYGYCRAALIVGRGPRIVREIFLRAGRSHSS